MKGSGGIDTDLTLGIERRAMGILIQLPSGEILLFLSTIVWEQSGLEILAVNFRV